MYLVAKEVMSDLMKLQLLPFLFEKKPVENKDILVDEALLSKVSADSSLPSRSQPRRSSWLWATRSVAAQLH